MRNLSGTNFELSVFFLAKMINSPFTRRREYIPSNIFTNSDDFLFIEKHCQISHNRAEIPEKKV